MLHLVTILLAVSGARTWKGGWVVKYPNNPVCAVRGFSVSIPCRYYQQNLRVKEMLWCSMNSNSGECKEPPYVYNSSSSTESDFQYAGDNTSNCTLLIRNVQSNYSGRYRFRLITDEEKDKYTGDPGVTLQVSDLKVSLIRLSGNGTLKPGDWLNLTCDVNCTHTSSQFMWTKNNELLNTSGSVLHFPALTLRDSGNYTCTWKTDRTSGSDTISLQVEDENQWKIWIIVSVTAGVIFIILVVGVVIYSKRFVHTKHQSEDDSVYANIPQRSKGCGVYDNIQERNKDFAIYANVK